MSDIYAKAIEQADQRDDTIAHGLVGGVIGNLTVLSRFHTGKRWQYLVNDRRTGENKAMRGYELVKEAHRASMNGLVVTMPNKPWQPREIDVRDRTTFLSAGYGEI